MSKTAEEYLKERNILQPEHTKWIVTFSDDWSEDIVELMESYTKQKVLEALEEEIVPIMKDRYWATFVTTCKEDDERNLRMAKEYFTKEVKPKYEG